MLCTLTSFWMYPTNYAVYQVCILEYANQKGFLCYDPQVCHLYISRNVIFFENQYFFQHLDPLDRPSIVSLPNFSENKLFVKFNLDSVYHRRCNETTTKCPPLDPPPASGPTKSPPLHRSTRISNPPHRHDISHTSLMAPMSFTSIYTEFILRLCNMTIGKRLRRMSWML